MISVVGLGLVGCRIANCFKKYPEYEVYNISKEKEGTPDHFRKLVVKNSPEEYENNPPNLKRFFKNLKSQVLFVVSGASLTSALSLVLLEQIVKQREVTVMYLSPEVDFLSEQEQLNERAVSGILQHYALSGAFKNMCIVKNSVLQSAVGDVPISKLYSSMNALVANSWHMINVFKNSKPVVGSLNPDYEQSSIMNIGVVDPDSGAIQFLSNLEGPKVISCIYGIPEAQLENDASLLGKIRDQVKKIPNVESYRFGVYSTSYEYTCAFAVEFSRNAQNNS